MRQVFRRQIFRWADLSVLLLIALVLATGALTAFGVRAFESAVEWLFGLGYEALPRWLQGLGLPGWSAFVLYPSVLGLLLAGVKRGIPPDDRLHAIPFVILCMSRRDGLIRPLSTLLKSLAAVLTLGAGGSLGREGPVVLLGSGIGSWIGQVTRAGAGWRNAPAASGAAAAIATAFHAPLTGTFFAMEIVLFHFSARSFALAALGATAAAVLSRHLAGGPAFPIPAYSLQSLWQIPLFIGLGLAMAPLARLYIAVIYGGEEWGRQVRGIPDWLKPALGGVLFGLIGLALPETLGPGFPTIQAALFGSLPLFTLALLLVAKLAAIGLTSGSGWTGGVFTPGLFLGAMAGGIYGHLASLAFPGLSPHPGAYAVVGMAAMIAGVNQAPLTAMALIMEVTLDFGIALPAMLACGIAAVFSQRINPYSVDTVNLPAHGILLPWQVHDLREMKVEQAMAREVHTVSAEMDLRQVIELMQRTRHGGYPVVDSRGELVGMITLKDVRDVPVERRLATPVTAVMTRNVITITPDRTVAEAAVLMARHGIGRLPVVSKEDGTHLVGILSRTDILRSYPTLGDAQGDPLGQT